MRSKSPGSIRTIAARKHDPDRVLLRVARATSSAFLNICRGYSQSSLAKQERRHRSAAVRALDRATTRAEAGQRELTSCSFGA